MIKKTLTLLAAALAGSGAFAPTLEGARTLARSLVDVEARLEAQMPGVIFIATELGLDGEELRSAHRIGVPRRERPVGKAAAAHDYEDGAAGSAAELELQGVGR
mgnify:CR=1 FL=1